MALYSDKKSGKDSISKLLIVLENYTREVTLGELYSGIEMIFTKVDSTKLTNMIANRPGTPLELITKMTKIINRINLKSARTIFNSLRTSLKIKLPVDLTSRIDGIIINNMTSTMDQYAYDLSAIR